MKQKNFKPSEILAHGFSSESTQRELSNEYQLDKVYITGLEIKFFSREPNCIFKSHLKVLCIETSTFWAPCRNLMEPPENIQGSPGLLAPSNIEPWLAFKNLCNQQHREKKLSLKSVKWCLDVERGSQLAHVCRPKIRHLAARGWLTLKQRLQT